MGCYYMSKNKVEVIIGGHIYSLRGDESQEHIQKVAALINEKINDIQKSNIRTHLSTSKIHMLTALNIASEYLKVQDELTAYAMDLEKCSAENIALKDKIQEMALELTEAKNQLASTNGYHKKNDYKNRGR